MGNRQPRGVRTRPHGGSTRREPEFFSASDQRTQRQTHQRRGAADGCLLSDSLRSAAATGGGRHVSSRGAPRLEDCTMRRKCAMKRVLSLIVVVALLATIGCANMTPTQQRPLSGGAAGAAGGAALGAIVGGSPAIGAAVGGGAGAAAGALWDDINRAFRGR